VKAHNGGGVEAQNGAVEGREGSQWWRRRGSKWATGSVDQMSHMDITLTLSRIWIRIRITVKSRIQIGIEVRRWIRTRIRIKGLRIRTLMYNLLYYG
jgi:hypothetical protein